MKELLNWRMWVIYALLTAGILTALLIFGNDSRPLGAWIEARICFTAISASCFYVMHRLAVHWESKGKIHLFNQ